MDRLGQIPTVVQHFEYDGWRFEVVDMDCRRVDQVLVSPNPSDASNTAA